MNQEGQTRRRRKEADELLPVLDLHGYRLKQAIRRLTDFLEEQQRNRNSQTATTTRPAEVLVITGTGSHSGSTGGPVLRGAVEDLLNRRHMQYTRDTPGSFLIDCQSGITFETITAGANNTTVDVHHYAVDTKICVESAESESVQLRLAEKKRRRQQQQRLRHSSSSGLSAASSSSSSDGINTNNTTTNNFMADCPSLTQVAQEDADLQRGKDASLELARQYQKQKSREQNELERGIRLSIMEEYVERDKEQQNSEILKAVAFSKKEHEASEKEEEDLLQQAMALSLQDQTCLREQREQEMLQHAIALSRQQEVSEREEEDRILNQVLAQSKQELDISNGENDIN